MINNGMELPKYDCHKQVWALKIQDIKFDSEIAKVEDRETDGSALLVFEDSRYAPIRVDADVVARSPEIGGYYVVYKDGYQSFSPAVAFEDGYILADINARNFGWAIEQMWRGRKVRRIGWNGRGICIAMQKPDENSKMTQPYIYIDTTGLVSENSAAPRGCVPWLASQTDMLAQDWELAS